jgi:hypothetical protein
MSLSKNSFALLALLGLFFVSEQAFAQREIYSDSIPFKDRLYFGGNLGLQFGTVTFVDVSPLVGVMITPRLSGGVGATFQYYDDSRFRGADGTSYGGRVFGRYNILPNIFAHAEYESINWESYDLAENAYRRGWSNALFLGGGYFVPFGRRGGANFTFLYDVLHDNQNSYYAEPYVIRVGFVL